MKEQRQEGAQVKNTDNRPHGVALDNRSHAVLTGVSDVLSFHEEEVVLDTSGGEMTITGKNLHIAKLTLEDGHLTMDGHIDAITYQEGTKRRKSGSMLTRIFR